MIRRGLQYAFTCCAWREGGGPRKRSRLRGGAAQAVPTARGSSASPAGPAERSPQLCLVLLAAADTADTLSRGVVFKGLRTLKGSETLFKKQLCECRFVLEPILECAD